MVYPLLLLGVAVLSVVFLLAFVVPRLSGALTTWGGYAAADGALATTGLIGRYWWILLWVGRGVVFGKGLRRRRPAAGRSTRWRCAACGGRITRVVISCFARVGNASGRRTILDALEIAGQATSNWVTVDAVTKVGDLVRQAVLVAAAHGRGGHFLPVLRATWWPWRETGDLPRMLLRGGEPDFEVDAAMRRLTTALEPGCAGHGRICCLIVLSILPPIFQANSAVR